MGELERRGQWWLPGHENQKVAGAFTFSPADGVRLKLDGWLDPGQMPRPGSENLYPSILGLTSDGNEVTLWDCWETGWAGSSSGSVTATLQADAAYIGAHFCGPDEPRFHRFAATYSGLHNWVRQNVFRTDYGTDNVTSLPRCRIEYAPPADLVADTSKGKLRVTG